MAIWLLGTRLFLTRQFAHPTRVESDFYFPFLLGACQSSSGYVAATNGLIQRLLVTVRNNTGSIPTAKGGHCVVVGLFGCSGRRTSQFLLSNSPGHASAARIRKASSVYYLHFTIPKPVAASLDRVFGPPQPISPELDNALRR